MVTRTLVCFVLVLVAGVLADGELNCGINDINIGRTILDSAVVDYVYATEDQQDIYLLTDRGTVYRSMDRGASWQNQMAFFPQWNNASISASASTGVKDLHTSGVNGVVYFEGHGMAFWATRGDGSYKLHTFGYVEGSDIVGDYIYKMRAHPTQENYIMVILWDALCFSTEYETCFFKTQISEFQGFDGTWNVINDYTFSAHWGGTDEMVLVETMAEEYRIPNQLGVGYGPGYELVVFTEYGNTVQVIVPDAIDFQFINGVLYFAKYVEGGDPVTYLSTDLNSANEMVFGGSGNYTGVYFQILATTPDVSMITVQTEFGNPYGNLFQSATNDPNYWTSLPNVRMSGAGTADFYQTLDLEGIYMANVYDEAYLGGPEENYHTKTMITFDNGGQWSQTLTNDEEPVHLFLTREYVQVRPHSNENAVGIIFSLGNIGTVSQPEDDINLFLSRSAGYRWEQVLEGVHFFSFNDHASVVIALEAPLTTGVLKYSWDQGLNWDACTWGDDFYVRAIHALTSSENGLQFLVVGEYENGEGTVLYVDFEDAVPRACTEGDDFEIFQPAIGEVCLLGQSTSYLRRKRDVACASPGVTQQEVDSYSCECAREDYQCDGDCFEERHIDGELNTACVNICAGLDNDPTLPPEDCQGFYLQTQGYKKIPGDVCVGGGEGFEPLIVACPGEELTPSATPSPSESPKSPTLTATPTLSVKVDDESTSATMTPSSTVALSESSTPSIVSATESESPYVSSPVEETITPSISASAAVEESIVRSQSPSPTPSMTQKGSISTDTETSGGSSLDTTGENSSYVTPTEDSSSWMYLVIGSLVVGLIGVVIVIILGVAVVIYNKKRRGVPPVSNADDDLFSLEDNDEWEL